MALRIDFVTIFPKMFEPLLAEGVIARGVKQGLLDIRVWDLRDFAAEICQKIDLGQKTMTVSLPEGLDDLDAVAD